MLLAAIVASLVCAPGALAQGPDTTIDSAPPGLTNSASASFTFSGTGTSFQCKLDAGAFTPCTSPRDLSGLLDGEHTFQVRAVSGAGGSDPTPASHTWTVDTTPPDTFITSTPPAVTGSTSATFGFAFSESGSFQCSLDGAAYAQCSPPLTIDGLPGGSHTFAVRAIDQAQNVDASPATYTWTVDTTPPDTTITHGPVPLTYFGTSSFQFTATEPGGFECAFDGGAFAACTSPMSRFSTDGPHHFEVRATDAFGNVDPTPATRDWTVDSVPPSPPSVSIEAVTARGPTPPLLPAGRAVSKTERFQLTRTLRVRWSGGGPYIVYYRKYRAGTVVGVGEILESSASASESATFTAEPGHTYCWHVYRRDAAGNNSETTKVCTSMPYRVSQAVHQEWTLTKSPASYFRQYASGGTRIVLDVTQGTGLEPAKVKQLGLVVTTCPTCGKVEVSWEAPTDPVPKIEAGVRAAATKKTLNLKSKTTRRRRLLTVRTFRGTTAIGGVIIRRIQGSPRIEGIAIGP